MYALSKAGFDENEARDRRGRWAASGSEGIDVSTASEDSIREFLHSKLGPNAVITINPHHRYLSIRGRTRGGDFQASYQSEKKEFHIGWMTVSNDAAGRMAAGRFINLLRDMAMSSDIDRVTIYATFEMGGFTWPSLGFAFDRSDEDMERSYEALRTTVTSRLGALDEDTMPRDAIREAQAIVDDWKPDSPARLSQLNTVVPWNRSYGSPPRGQPTLGKYLLAGTSGYYFADRATLARLKLQAAGQLELPLGKAGFDPNEARDRRGRWAEAGGLGADLTASPGAIEDAVRDSLRDPNARVYVHRYDDGEVTIRGSMRGGTFSAQYFPETKEFYIGSMTARNNAAGRLAAGQFMNLLRDIAVSNDVEKVTVYGTLEMGGYSWPSLGFDFDRSNDDKERKFWSLQSTVDSRLHELEVLDSTQTATGGRGSLSYSDLEEARTIVDDWQVDSPTALTKLTSVVPDQIWRDHQGGERPRGQLTLGKYLLAGTSGYYIVTREKLTRLQQRMERLRLSAAGQLELPLGKAGFDPNEPRNDKGEWTNGGASIDLNTVGAKEFRDFVRRTIPGISDWNVEIKRDPDRVRFTLGKNGAWFDATYSKVTQTLRIQQMRAPDNFAGQRIAGQFIYFLRDIGLASGVQQVKVTAALQSGGYTWPHLGFDLDLTSTVGRDASAYLREQVRNDIIRVKPYITDDSVWEQARTFANNWTTGSPRGLARIDYPLPKEAWGDPNAPLDYVHPMYGSGDRFWRELPRGKLTLGKFLLAGSSADYVINRAGLANLRFSKVAKAGYRDDEPRDEDGKWTSDGGTSASRPSLNLDVHDRSLREPMKQYIERLFPGADAYVEDYGVLSVHGNGKIEMDLGFNIRRNGSRSIEVHWLKSEDSAEGRRAAQTMMGLIRNTALDSGADAIYCEGSGSTGGYAWPRLGFDLKNRYDIDSLRGQVEDRLDALPENYSVEVGVARAILEDGGSEMATRLARLKSPVSVDDIERFAGHGFRLRTSVEDRPTFGKLLLLGTDANYVLPRAKFDNLRPRTSKSFGKEFDPDEPRVPSGQPGGGQWTNGGGSGRSAKLDLRTMSEGALRGELARRFPGLDYGSERGNLISVRWHGQTALIHVGEDIHTPPFMELQIDLADKVLEAKYLSAEETKEGKEFALTAMAIMRDMAIASGLDTIKTHAGLSMGGYLWPRLGFELDPKYSELRFWANLSSRAQSLYDNGWITQSEYNAIDTIIQSRNANGPTAIARMNRVLPNEVFSNVTVPRGFRGAPSIGRLMLAGTDAYYKLPSSRFNTLGRITKVAKAGFDEDEPRDRRGRWTRSGSARSQSDALDIRRVENFDLAAELSRRTGLDVEVTHNRYDHRYVIIGTPPDRSPVSGQMKFTVSEDGKQLEATYLEFSNTRAGSAIAMRAMAAMRDFAMSSGTEEITANAGLSMGGFTWPRIGFDLDDRLPAARQDINSLWSEIESKSEALYFNHVLTDDEFDAIHDIVQERKSDGPRQIARMGRVVTDENLRYRNGYIIRGDLTVGKLILATTQGRYVLTRDRFNRLGPIGKMMAKAGYRDDEPRDEDGKWTTAGGLISGEKLPRNMSRREYIRLLGETAVVAHVLAGPLLNTFNRLRDNSEMRDVWNSLSDESKEKLARGLEAKGFKVQRNSDGSVDVWGPDGRPVWASPRGKARKAGYKDDEPRDRRGRWAFWGGGGGGTNAPLDLRNKRPAGIENVLRARFPEAYVRADTMPHDYKVGVVKLHTGSELKFTLDPNGHLFVNTLFTDPNSPRDGVRMMALIRDIAVASQSSQIETFAAGEMGGFAWPYLGFSMNPVSAGVRDHVERVLGYIENTGIVPKDEIDKVLALLGSFDVDTPTKLARLNYQITDPRAARLAGALRTAGIRGKMTLGKLLLAGSAGDYVLPRAKFSVLARLGN